VLTYSLETVGVSFRARMAVGNDATIGVISGSSRVSSVIVAMASGSSRVSPLSMSCYLVSIPAYSSHFYCQGGIPKHPMKYPGCFSAAG